MEFGLTHRQACEFKVMHSQACLSDNPNSTMKSRVDTKLDTHNTGCAHNFELGAVFIAPSQNHICTMVRTSVNCHPHSAAMKQMPVLDTSSSEEEDSDSGSDEIPSKVLRTHTHRSNTHTKPSKKKHKVTPTPRTKFQLHKPRQVCGVGFH